MGVRSSLVAPTAIHQSQAFQKNSVNAASLVAQLQTQIAETVLLLREVLKTLPGGNLLAASSWTTASTTIVLAQPAPSWVTAGMNVFDNTNSQQIGTVASASGTTLTLTLAAAHASAGSSDTVALTDANAATYTAQIAALS
jgi:hypothetical protein